MWGRINRYNIDSVFYISVDLFSIKENTISNLKKAMYHADSFDNLRPGEQYFTSIFVSSVSDDPAGYTKNYGGSLKTGTLKQLASKSLDFLRSDSDFLNLLQE